MPSIIKIKNWHKFQHFKDRRPPWVKLHREIMEQRDINVISDCSFRVLVNLWLLASEDETREGIIPSVDDIAFRLRIDKKKIINSLEELKPFLIQDDITLISDEHQADAPETETETETETEKALSEKPDDVNLVFEFWQLTMNHPKAQLDDDRKKRIKNALKLGYTIDDLKAAIRGCAKTPHNMGQNDRNGIYDGLNIILKNADNIDRFIKNDTNQQRPNNQGSQSSYDEGASRVLDSCAKDLGL